MFAAIAALALHAQISGLATTADGRQLYFSTALRLQGTSEAGYSKIFHYADQHFDLFRQLTLDSTPGVVSTNYYRAVSYSVSSDGREVLYNAGADCTSSSQCIDFTYNVAVLAGANANADTVVGDSASLSPDGLYLLTVQNSYLGQRTLALSAISGDVPINLTGYSPIGASQELANGGVALLADQQGPLLWRNGTIQRLNFAEPATSAAISANAQTVAYESLSNASIFELHTYDVISSNDRVLVSAAPPPNYNNSALFYPTITADGSQLIYLLNHQVYLSVADGSSKRQLTAAPEGITEATISGSGNIVYAATATGRLLQIDVSSGATQELVAAVPHIQVSWGALVPGALLDVSVTNGPPGNSDPALRSSHGPPAPIVARSATGVTLQIPWDLPVSSQVSLVVVANPSPFEEDQDMQLQAGIPEFLPATTPPGMWPPYPLAAHQDFHGLVTDADPAQPGETVHVYFTGLGAVSPAIATGVPAPAGALYMLQTPFSCQFQEGPNLTPANILYAGLAPGTIGIEQVDIRLPDRLTAAGLQLDCLSGQAIGTISGYAQIPIRVARRRRYIPY